MIEKEFKVLLTEEQYKKIREAIQWEKSFVQKNYYYLDSEDELRSADITVRIREKNGKYMLQTKVPKLQEGALAIKEEKEREIDRVYKELNYKEYENLISIKSKCLKNVGSLNTERRIVHIGECEIALDKNYYLGKTDYELEIEYYSDEIPHEVIQMMSDLGDIKFEKRLVGKNKRFLKELDKKMQKDRLKKKKKINWFVNNAVKKPVIFVAYIFIGMAILLALAIKIKVPVYKTYEGICKREAGNQIVVELKQALDSEDSIFVYVDQDENIWQINNYEVNGKSLIIHDDIDELIGKVVSVDVKLEEIILLKMVIVGGGNG
ncbi:putative triphosphatase YjbK [Clostridium tepidiprofundi DSM 19306]|uniref:Putative triphosphatase YjbK n=1 Tax=Clostridium tepidiprofundi DSM 19306 TaxID=1121338 RepID=A0A151B216_9CLOT|nr:CYTH domain-containing protein [Clostridium tepidiprofundi]KYH33961.1 putative triphosphatase YjbK [Clostridium tepidiprofundi DSM 19306]